MEAFSPRFVPTFTHQSSVGILTENKTKVLEEERKRLPCPVTNYEMFTKADCEAETRENSDDPHTVAVWRPSPRPSQACDDDMRYQGAASLPSHPSPPHVHCCAWSVQQLH